MTQPVAAGVVAALVGFTSSFAVVLAGLRAVGASADQAASGLFTLCVVMAVLVIGLSRRYRMPVSIAWSTPGAALLLAAGHPAGGFGAAVGAFLVAGALTVLAGLWRPLGRAIEALPVPIASALLAGVLLPICLAPVRAVAEIPALAGPAVLTWAVLLVVARRWAVPGALVAAAVALAIDGSLGTAAGAPLLPTLTLTAPSFTLEALLSIALPLFVVTMASQNIAGLGVLKLHGYRVPLPPVLVTTGAASMAGAPFGAHAVNLAAITAALTAGPDAHPDPGRRWHATIALGAAYAVIGLSVGLVTAVVAEAPPLLVEAVAGLGLIGALGGSLAAATRDETERDPAIVTFVTAASGITVAGLSGPVWGLAAGLALRAMLRRRPTG